MRYAGVGLSLFKRLVGFMPGVGGGKWVRWGSREERWFPAGEFYYFRLFESHGVSGWSECV